MAKSEYAKIDVDKLTLDPANARSHPDSNLEAIKGSLLKFGQQRPILVDRKHVVIAGNGTLMAAKALGWEKIDVRYTDLSGPEAIAYALADNRTAELAEWDKNILGAQLQALYEDGFGIADIGFDPGEWIKDIVPNTPFDAEKEDEIPTDVPTRVKPGEIWQLGEHRLMCGDSTSSKDVKSLFEDGRAALCFTSPPYADQREYKGGKELSTEHLATFISVAAQSCELFAVNLGISRKDGEINQYWDDYIKAAKESHLRLLSWNVWNKGEAGSIGNQTAMFAISHEWIFVFGENKSDLNRTVPNKSAGYLANHNGNRQADGSVKKHKDMIIGEFSQLKTVYAVTAQKARDDIDHPARFPVEFPLGYIEACTDPGDWVYEPFCGSGTTLIACEKTGRKCFGMEIDPAYCDIILTRWESLTGRQAVLVAKG